MDQQLQIAALTATVANLSREIAGLRIALESNGVIKAQKAVRRDPALPALVAAIAAVVGNRSFTLADPQVRTVLAGFGTPKQIGCALRSAKGATVAGVLITRQDKAGSGALWRFSHGEKVTVTVPPPRRSHTVTPDVDAHGTSQ